MGHSQVVKAANFDSAIPRFESWRPSQLNQQLTVIFVSRAFRCGTDLAPAERWCMVVAVGRNHSRHGIEARRAETRSGFTNPGSRKVLKCCLNSEDANPTLAGTVYVRR
jgi:hypothetical protein